MPGSTPRPGTRSLAFAAPIGAVARFAATGSPAPRPGAVAVAGRRTSGYLPASPHRGEHASRRKTARSRVAGIRKRSRRRREARVRGADSAGDEGDTGHDSNPAQPPREAAAQRDGQAEAEQCRSVDDLEDSPPDPSPSTARSRPHGRRSTGHRESRPPTHESIAAFNATPSTAIWTAKTAPTMTAADTAHDGQGTRGPWLS